MCIKWGKNSSTYFNVSNGLRQGGVLSPKLFAIFVDDLPQDLAMCKSGCYIDDQCMNHVMYVDDICLLAPSAIGLQRMLDVCFDFSIRNDIKSSPIILFLNLYTLFLNLKILSCIVLMLDWTAIV